MENRSVIKGFTDDRILRSLCHGWMQQSSLPRDRPARLSAARYWQFVPWPPLRSTTFQKTC